MAVDITPLHMQLSIVQMLFEIHYQHTKSENFIVTTLTKFWTIFESHSQSDSS